MTQKNNRPAIKNNLNEQLKIYYNYRDENNRKYSKNSSQSQFTFRHIPEQPPAIIQRHQTTSFQSQRDSTPLKKIHSSSNIHSQSKTNILQKIDNIPNNDFLQISPSQIDICPKFESQSKTNTTLRKFESQSKIDTFSKAEPQSKTNTTLRKFESQSKIDTLRKVEPQAKTNTLRKSENELKFELESKSENALASGSLCPLCKISFDSGGLHRPVSDACGHTTCFQCFREIMINATGCSLCQKEEDDDYNSQKNVNDFEDALFDDWSLNQSSTSSSLSKSKFLSIKSFDYDDRNDFETHETTIPSFDDDDDDDDEDDSSIIDQVAWIANDVHDDGPEYQDKQFSHTKIMLERFHALFGLKKFRSNQQEAVNCALERRFHVFVLMPTGGGKSLCYQLPSVLDKGITFVVSPLRSLILDQTQKLLSLGIPCASLTGDRTAAETSAIYAQCYSSEPKLKIVYVTPEKISQSDQLNKLFSHLYTKNNLARFVIDEAHCISDWGHDFRPDYVKIGTLRDRYPHVPFTLLTATATPRVQRDMLHQMKIERHLCKLFIQSFNRSNLVYKCFSKGKTEAALSRTVQLCLSEQFAGMCGIVYCFSRLECEKSASYLTKNGVSAQAYHAGLNDQERSDVQNQWANDEYQVICATIAFGMGIDKPNVRFVIHLSMPKSIEGYYQESGRAGRDGEQAYCYLFYSYQDLVKTKRLIMTEQSVNATREARKVRLENLHRVYAYCLNDVDCRRTLLLEYFGERYLSSQCKKHYQTRCDNCCSVAQTKSIDLTDLSKEICHLVDHLNRQSKSTTIYQIIDILKGSKQKFIKDAGYDQLKQFNIAEPISRTNLERLLSKLILDGYLYQDIIVNDTYGTASAYIRLGNRNDFLEPITLSICVKKENENLPSIKSTNSLRHRLVDQCLIKLKDELKLISSEYNIKYSTILSEKALKQMASIMPRTKEDMLKKTIELTKIKYDMYQLDRLLSITCQFGSKLDEENRDDSSNAGLKRKRDTTITSDYFQDKTNSNSKKKK